MRLVTCACAMLLLLSLPVHSDEKTTSKEDVMNVVNRLFDVMRSRDVAGMRQLFSPEGRLLSIFKRDGQKIVRNLSVDDFAKMVEHTKETYSERMFEPEVQISGDLATVWGWYDFHVGEQLTNCGTNAFQLLRTDEGWKIAQIVSTIQTTDCDRLRGGKDLRK